MIKGIALSDISRLYIKIINQSDQEIVSLETTITSDNTFSLPWIVPQGFDTGIYTIKASDDVNSYSFEIFIP